LIRSIEGMRGVAALLVALFHAYVYNKWGGFPAQSKVLQHAWLFVDLFFVISGFVMATVYSERLETPRSAWAYMVRRFFRLYPLHVVTTAAAILAVIAVQTAKLVLLNFGVAVGNEPPFSVKFFDLGLLVADLLLLQGVGIIRMEIHNYPSWSISVEFWLYLTFALLTLAVRSRLARIVASIVIVAASVAWFVVYWSYAAPELRTLDTRGLPRGLLSFFQGVLLYYLYRWIGDRLPAGGGLLGIAQVLSVALALWLVARQDVLGTAQLAIPFAFALVVFLILPDRGIVSDALQTRPMQWLGKHSYSIYLTHVPVLTLLSWPGQAFPEPAKHLVGLAFLAGVFGVSVLTYRYIEKPWRDRGKVIADRIETAGSFQRRGDAVSS
jgi:peptidoglycan/LPS O-acetylase OafA/YrhL